MGSFMLNTVTSQLPKLVETYEPQIENTLRTTLRNMKAKYPNEANLFLTNWTKLNKAVQEELAPVGGRKKRTLRRKGHK